MKLFFRYKLHRIFNPSKLSMFIDINTIRFFCEDDKVTKTIAKHLIGEKELSFAAVNLFLTVDSELNKIGNKILKDI